MATESRFDVIPNITDSTMIPNVLENSDNIQSVPLVHQPPATASASFINNNKYWIIGVVVIVGLLICVIVWFLYISKEDNKKSSMTPYILKTTPHLGHTEADHIKYQSQVPSQSPPHRKQSTDDFPSDDISQDELKELMTSTLEHELNIDDSNSNQQSTKQSKKQSKPKPSKKKTSGNTHSLRTNIPELDNVRIEELSDNDDDDDDNDDDIDDDIDNGNTDAVSNPFDDNDDELSLSL